MKQCQYITTNRPAHYVTICLNKEKQHLNSKSNKDVESFVVYYRSGIYLNSECEDSGAPPALNLRRRGKL